MCQRWVELGRNVDRWDDNLWPMDYSVDAPLTVVWSGLDLRPGIAGGASAARTSVREQTWTPRGGRGSRYELLALASRVRPAAFLTSVELRDRLAIDAPLPEVAWHDDLVITWSLLYRYVASTGPEVVVPYAIYVLGVNPPADLDATQTQEFNDFYTNVHMLEVAEQRGALRASRYELDRELAPPGRGAPRFLAVYEVDENGARQRKHVGPPYQRGPEVWQKHTTPWRLWYQRIPD